ncbi:hypothetical protein LF887_01995 [Chryseobacterium sp. MEBOG06]|uniref:bacteriocin-like protein n=1 Tax=Chryseobacterium sp. MEBOG06 TaxID=2879938 RepID=UPI001F1C1A29|nr:hypothetical protein [Chryseobacterium sp. MEBOG06]UKB84447.1 hypothetical protein LF887_01995 [Chryseobacterium sp. MEBOG06]
MKNLKKLSRNELKTLNGFGSINPFFSEDPGEAEGCKQCVSCSNRQGSQSCYTDPKGDCGKALSMAQSLC